jgi:hypothetical protein
MLHSQAHKLGAVATAVFLLAGCANLHAPGSAQAASAAAAAASAPASAASGATAAARPPEPGAPKPFADIIKEAKQQDGFLPVWRKDEKVWLEIPADRVGKPFLLTVNIASSVGERGMYASQMGPNWVAEFRRVGNTLQLIAKNLDFRGGGDAALQQTVRQAFSDSLLGSTAVLSAEHPERKSFLVDASFLLSDLPGYSTRLEAAYRLPYALDRGNSFFEAARASAAQTTLNASLHFATPRIPAPPMTPSPVPMPSPPTTTPDPRSLFIGTVINFAQLPAEPMAPRSTDPRLGHFADVFTDLSGDFKANPRVHYVTRWRLEKKDPQAALSEPVTPITFWLDRNIPVRYRASVEAGILEWNKAYERIGFKNAVVAKQQPDDADFDGMDATHASIRWFTGADVGFAIGPSQTDLRTGEILDADIGMSDVFARGARRLIVEDLGLAGTPAQPTGRHGAHDNHAFCEYADQAAAEMEFALDLIEARGDIAPDSPEAEAFVQAVIKDVMMHEVGHTLGLKHNFKASTTITRAQLQDKAFTDSQGISGSVMDYNAYNLPLRGERPGNFNNTTLGAYDYWAIEYAYKPFDKALTAEQQAAELKKIAARSTEPALAYADDADAGGFGPYDGMDPLANRFDLGDDPLAYYRKRLALSREVWDRTQARGPRADEDPLRQRRVLASGFRLLRTMPTDAAKYVGGMYAVRDLPGSTERPSFKPVEPARQREALQFLAKGIFSVDSFRFKPEFLANLTPDYNEWERGGLINIPAVVLQLQTQALDRLLAANTAQRVLDLPSYLPEGQRKGIISLNEVYATLQSAVWSELKSGKDVERMRRNLQREHLKRLQTLLTRGSATLPADALSLVRMNAVQLQSSLRGAADKPGLSVEAKAHLQESLSTLTEALRATMQRG